MKTRAADLAGFSFCLCISYSNNICNSGYSTAGNVFLYCYRHRIVPK
ncbi:MAG: hypothetical protein BMS9Abin01_2617 [Gammaproteobacteria bacterium]|nr:MAG: hypothetical protein BMS9Abin01_2617 [Gammaproteobacteria bacterium]